VIAGAQVFKGSITGGKSTAINAAGAVVALLLAALWFARGLLPKPAEEAPLEGAPLEEALLEGTPDHMAPSEQEGHPFRDRPDGPERLDSPASPESEALALESGKRRTEHEALMLSAAAFAAALVIGLVARDLAFHDTSNREGIDQPGAIRLLQLFTYNYRRPWPEDIDFTAILTAFGVVALLLALLLAVRKIRQHAVVAFTAFAVVWAVWGLDVYMVKLAPHWGQREVIQAYYDNRGSPQEPLVAYQMNWKGENFYTSNKVPAFISSGSAFTSWIKQQRDKGVHVMYFILEHSRTGGLKSEAGARVYREVTDKHLCNKFVLVRAEF